MDVLRRIQEITNNRQDRTVFKRLTDPTNGLSFPVSILLLFGGVVLNHSSSGSRFQENASTGKPVLIELPSITGQAGLKQFRI